MPSGVWLLFGRQEAASAWSASPYLCKGTVILVEYLRQFRCLVVANSLQSDGLQPTRLSVHGILQAGMLEWVSISFSRGIFPAYGLNPGLLHCSQILYLLSYEGSPSREFTEQLIPRHLQVATSCCLRKCFLLS